MIEIEVSRRSFLSSNVCGLDYFHKQLDLDPLEARQRIERLLKRLNGQADFHFPEKSKDTVKYDSGRLRMKLPFTPIKITNRTHNRFCTLLQILLDLNVENMPVTKCAIFYKDKEEFGSQTVSDLLIDQACCLIGATRRSLGIKASPNGFVIGSLVIREEGKVYDLLNCEELGKLISPLMLDFEVVSCKAKFILVVEKEAYYSSLIEDKFHRKVDCILITGRGMSDMATRYFLRNLTKKLNIPVFALVDCDPYGIKILCTYTYGSENLAYDCDNLVTRGIKWLGVRPSDLDKYHLSSGSLKRSKKKIVEELKVKDFIMDKDSWLEELNEMSNKMRSCDLDFLNSATVLNKLAHKDWLNNEV